jgi:hypothetical protein
MKFRLHRINWNLATALILAGLVGGCATSSKEDEKISTIRLHLEVNPQMVKRSMEVTVLRAHPVKLTVAEEPMIHEGYVDKAEIVTDGGTHSIRLTFDDSGRRMLVAETAAHLGKRVAVSAQFPELRWLAAPAIKGINTNGVFTFTPDADLAECRRLVDGLNIVIEKRKKEEWLK